MIDNPVSTMPDYVVLTEAFIEKADGSQVIDSLVAANGMTAEEALAWTVAVQASGNLPVPRTPGEEAQGLSLWHGIVAGMCSTTYRELKSANPNTNRNDLNKDEALQKLNAVRKGLRVAMRTSYKRAKTELVS